MNVNNNPSIAILIPAYNAAKTIGSVITEAIHYVSHIIVVDDASSDNTVEVAKQSGCEVLVHSQNQGKGGALRTGFKRVLELNIDWLIIMDADGQHQPKDLSKFIQVIKEEKYSFLNGTRLSNSKGMPYIRLLTNKAMSKLVSLILGASISDTQCGYKAFKAELIRDGKFFSQHFEIEDELIFEAVRLNLPIGHVNVGTVYNDEESYINPLVDTYRFFIFLFRYFIKK